jgi:hypothetical protein
MFNSRLTTLDLERRFRYNAGMSNKTTIPPHIVSGLKRIMERPNAKAGDMLSLAKGPSPSAKLMELLNRPAPKQ